MLDYDPKDAQQCFVAGEYQGVLTKYEEKTSKAGNPMAVMTWEVYSVNGSPNIYVTDYIVIPDGVWKLKKMAKALGKEREFDDRSFQPGEEKGCSLILVLGIQQQEGFDDKNTIKAYKPLPKSSFQKGGMAQRAVAKAQAEPVAAMPETGPHDDDIPF